MKIEIRKTDASPYSMEATNESGQTVQLDGSPDIGGVDAGMRPMELLATSLGGCSAIDVINILRKKREEPSDIHISIDAKRQQGVVPATFEAIHVHFTFRGKVSEEAAEKALQLSFEKYCSVTKILEPTCAVTHSFSIDT